MTTRPAWPTRWSSHGSRPCARSRSPASGCSAPGSSASSPPRISSAPIVRCRFWPPASRCTPCTWCRLIILGRTGRTELSFPATVAGTIVNVVLNLALVPSMGIVGAGIALVASYLLILAITYVLTQRLFAVPYEWRRLALVGRASPAAVSAAGVLGLPGSRHRGPRPAGDPLDRLPGAARRRRVPDRRGAPRAPGVAAPPGGAPKASRAAGPPGAGGRLASLRAARSTRSRSATRTRASQTAAPWRSAGGPASRPRRRRRASTPTARETSSSFGSR